MQQQTPDIPGIIYTAHAAIDKKKWNECIRKSHNGLVYSSAEYLDHMAGSWDALILNDYVAVLPLPWRKKFGIYYIYPPAFTQQLGVSALFNEDEKTVEAFLKAIPKKFRLVEMNMNATNQPGTNSTLVRNNYLLDLSRPYTEIRKGYSRSAIRNIKKSGMEQVTLIENAAPADIIQLHRKRFRDEIGNSAIDYRKFLSLVDCFQETDNCYCIAAANKRGELMAGSIYFIFKNRISFVINGNTDESLENGATHLLMDHTIRKFSGSSFILDFEGSDNPSFARFYQQYGATPETYSFIRINRLPWPVNLLKK
jgi:hypothetical protein